VVDAISPRALSELIGSIYDCALEPSRWEKALPNVMDALDCHAAVLHLNDLRNGRVLIHKNVGIEPCWLEQHAKHVPEIHTLLPPRPTLDEPHVLSRHVPRAVVEASPFVQGWLRPQGFIDIMQLFLMHTPTRFSGLGIAWHERHGVITEQEIELARLLLPHLRRAATISDMLDVRTIECTQMTEALDALRCAVVLMDGRGGILHTNRSAEHMLRDGGPIQSVQGILQASAPTAASELRAALALAARNEAGIGKTGLAIRLTEPDMPPIFAHVLPLTGSDFRTRLHPAAVAAVFISAPPDEQDGAETVAAAFGLTPAETRVLASLFAGLTLAETAAALRIAGTTAKTHLEHIFLKTGVTRQAELMRLWTGLISPTRSST
jgi:DNA-binding CsgD family transcriptional regulator